VAVVVANKLVQVVVEHQVKEMQAVLVHHLQIDEVVVAVVLVEQDLVELMEVFQCKVE
jgi:hypothetical protein